MKKLSSLIVFFIMFLSFPVFAQTGVSLETEIKNTERIVNSQGIPAAERHASLVRLARLRQLSGDIEGAAKNWLEAAAAIPGQVDDDALLACAYCLAAMGEWDRARTALEPLLAKSPRARFLSIGINALNTGNISALSEIAGAAEYSQMKNEIYYLLWKASSGSEAESWRQRLVLEFPQSAEGRIAAGGASQSVFFKPSPFWLFLEGVDALSLTASETAFRTQSAAQAASQTSASAPSSGALSSGASSSGAQANTPAGVKLQTGLFSREANAQSLAADLKKAGFSPSIERRVVNSAEMWAVTVPAGIDSNRTIRELREAGFDSFPLR